jgi:hypothetical protein
MSDTEVDISIPTEYYDFISIFVCIAVIFWGIRATRRFHRALYVRAASLEQSLVLIRGLGNNLLFFDYANQHHMHSLVHTRQAKPPSQMKTLYVPFAIFNTKLEWRSLYLVGCKADFWLATKSYVFVLWGFKLDAFKKKFYAMHEANPVDAINMFVTERPRPTLNLDRLVAAECCSQGSELVCLAPGSYSDYQFTIPKHNDSLK